MGILQRQTLGDTEYQLIDDLFPTYSAKTGTIAVSKHSNRVFIASPLPYDWIQTISPSAGAMSFIDFDNGNTQFTLAGPPDPGDWLGPTENYTSSGFTNHGGVFLSGSTLLTLSGTTKGKYLTTCQMSGVGTSPQANRWMQLEIAVGKNQFDEFVYGPNGDDPKAVQIGGTPGSQNLRCMVLAHAIHEMDGLQRDYIVPVYNIKDVSTTNKSQTSYDRDRGVMTMNLLDGGISWNEGFESGDFEVGDWVVVNGSETNEWIVGTGATNSGTYGAYISNDNNSWAYTNTAVSTTHIYRDITFPKFLSSDVYLDFYWKCDGEVGADYGRVSFYESTGATPTAGTELSTALNVGQSEYSNSTTYALETINLGAAGVLKDKTYRLVFSWENNGSVGSGPFAIDDLRLHFYVKNKEFQTTFLIDEDWESNSFTAHTWTLVNDSQNVWVVGTDNGTNHGTYSAYISDDGGTTASYTITNPEVSHLYIDFTIPSNAIDAELKFDWRSWAENAGAATFFDYGTVVIADTTTTPVAGTEVSTAVAALGGNGRIGATTNAGKFNEGYGGSDANWRTETIDMSSYIGTTKRLIFTWKNDGSIGNDPPFTIDFIVFKYNSFI